MCFGGRDRVADKFERAIPAKHIEIASKRSSSFGQRPLVDGD